MQRTAAIPYYTSGAAAGLSLGYLYAWLQVVQLIPGLGWMADLIRSVLPKNLSSAPSSSWFLGSSCPASAAAVAAAAAGGSDAGTAQDLAAEPPETDDVALSSGSFAVMDAGALGNALYAMERPTIAADISNISSSNLLPPTPHPSFQSRESPAASELRGLSVAQNTTRTIAAAAAGAGNPPDQLQLISSLRERLASFPLDNMSPSTTATALSLFSNLPPAGNSEYSMDESSAAELALGAGEPVEGELDFTVTNSTSSNLLPPDTPKAAAAAAADMVGGSSSSTTVLPQPGDTVVPLLALPGSRRAPSGATVKFAPGVTGSPAPSGVTSGITGYTTNQQQQQQQQGDRMFSGDSARISAALFTGSAMQQHDRHSSSSSMAPTAAADAAENNSYGLGSPRTAYAVGLPAQRVVVTKLSRTSSANSSTSSPRRNYEKQRQQRNLEGSPVATAAAAALAALTSPATVGSNGPASPGALQPPRQPALHTTGAAAAGCGGSGGGSSSSSSSTHVPAAAGEVSNLPASSSSSSSGGDDRRTITDTHQTTFKAQKPAPGGQGRVRTLNLLPSTPAATAAAAGEGAGGSPRSLQSLSSIRTTDSAATVERKKQKGLLSMLKSKAVKGRQQVR